MENPIEFMKVKHDINSNPRYVCHFLDLLTIGEQTNTVLNLSLQGKYDLALLRAKKIGGRKYNNKIFGGGIIFQTCNIDVLRNKIKDLLK